MKGCLYTILRAPYDYEETRLRLRGVPRSVRAKARMRVTEVRKAGGLSQKSVTFSTAWRV